MCEIMICFNILLFDPLTQKLSWLCRQTLYHCICQKEDMIFVYTVYKTDTKRSQRI